MTTQVTTRDISIAVLITCHNRKEKTLSCLASLYSQGWPEGTAFSVFLVDDGSTDGTGEAVRSAYPDVQVIRGSGTLFWCNGMRLAWDHAARQTPDFFLWLNDDVTLLEGALKRLLESFYATDCSQPRSVHHGSPINEYGPPNAEPGKDTIIVGSCCDSDTGEHTYGGQSLLGRHPFKLAPVRPGKRPLPCDTFNGNVVLVPRSVFEKVGNMRAFRHAMGDTDYGHRAKYAGCSILVAPGYIGNCDSNKEEDLSKRSYLSFRQRIRLLKKRLPPGDWFRLLWSHSGARAFLYWPIPYLRVALNLQPRQKY